MLVIMGGGYPNRDGEHNLQGDPGAAQAVAANWPTKVVWSGVEVGLAIATGGSISERHPASSPVRAAYEAFVGAGNRWWSWDLTAVYHAIRPTDSCSTRSDPGRTASMPPVATSSCTAQEITTTSGLQTAPRSLPLSTGSSKCCPRHTGRTAREDNSRA